MPGQGWKPRGEPGKIGRLPWPRGICGALGLPLTDADDLFVAVQGAYTVARTVNDPDLFRRGILRLRAGTPQLRPPGAAPA